MAASMSKLKNKRMKTTKKYIASEMGVTTNPEAILTARFREGHTFHGRLGDLVDWAKAKKVNTVQECTTDEGRHGLYPVLYAQSEAVAAALSVMRGYPVDLFDGVTFFNRDALRDCMAALHKASIVVPAGSAKWAITELPYANAAKPATNKEAQRELAFADVPF